MTKSIRPFVAQKQEFIVLHNSFFDHIMPNLGPCAWKVLCFIVRKTRGWNKNRDRIPFREIQAGTGIKDNKTVRKCLDELVSADLIIEEADDIIIVKGDDHHG